MAKNNNLTDFLVDLADGIYKAETGVTTRPTTEKIDPQDFRSRVEAIPANTLTNNAVARANTTISVTADDTNDKLTITAGNNQSTGYVAGANKTTTATVTLTASGANVTATVGNKSVTKSVGTATHTAPTATLDTTTGKVTTKHTATAGYVAAGTTTATLTLSTVATSTITPGTQNKTAVAQGKYTLGTVTVKGDADLVAANIKKGVEIFGVTGTFTSDATAAAADIYTGKTAYVNGTKVTGTMASVSHPVPAITLSTGGLITATHTQQGGKVAAGTTSTTYQITTYAGETITPTTAIQTVPISGKYATGNVTVNPIPAGTRAETTISVTADDTNDKLTITASNNQTTGYVGGNKATTATVTLTNSGAGVTATIGDKSVTRTVATVNRANTTMSVTTDTTNKKLTYTASNNQATGYVAGANKATSATVTLSTSGKTVTMSDGTNSVSLDYPTHNGQTVTPSVTSQTVSVSGKYMTGNIVVGAIPNQKEPIDVVANGPTVTVPTGWYNGSISKTVTTATRGTTTISVANGGSNAISISASNTQATGYVTGSTASSSVKVYITRTNNTVYLRPGSTSATAVMSLTVPAATHVSPTITLDSATGVITAQHIQATGYVTGHTATATLTIELAEDNDF